MSTEFQMESVHKALHSYALSTGLDLSCADETGAIQAASDHYAGTSFCTLMKSCAEGERRCRQSHVLAAQNAHNFGEPYITRCHAGLVLISAPLILGDVRCSLSAHPLMMWEWDEVAVEEFLRRTGDLPLARESLLVLSRAIRVLTGGQTQAMADMLGMVTMKLSEDGAQALASRQLLNRQQMRMADVVIESKRVDAIRALETRLNPAYPLHLESELMGRVRLGDRAGARGILNDLLGHIFCRMSGNIEIMKARILELVIMISRAAVESGAELNRLLGLNYNFILELSHLTAYEDVCLWVVKVLDTFMDTVYDTRNIKGASLLGGALDYIRTHFADALTLDAVSQHIHISPYYLSHLFKDELGITFVEYLTRVRIEEAKQLLVRTDTPVQSIASMVGYEDPSYFCKVFKKVTGNTPHRYRRGM